MSFLTKRLADEFEDHTTRTNDERSKDMIIRRLAERGFNLTEETSRVYRFECGKIEKTEIILAYDDKSGWGFTMYAYRTNGYATIPVQAGFVNYQVILYISKLLELLNQDI